MPDNPDDDEASTFTQEYDPQASEAKRLVIYCRLCRRIFPVTFKPRPTARLRCLCGHEAPLAELDVFESEDRAREFANLYQKLFQAAKQALRDANLPVPPTGRFDRIRDGEDPPSDIANVSDQNAEDMSDITSSYVGDGSDERDGARDKEAELREAVADAGDVLAKHDALSELVEHLYVLRHTGTGAFDRFRTACAEDMALAKDVVTEATRRKRAGKKVRVTFSSFKHLAIALEDEGDLAGALEVCDAARAVGLPGYDERATKLRAALPAAKPRVEAAPSSGASSSAKARITSKRSRDAWEVPTLPASGSRPALPAPALESKPAESKPVESKPPAPEKAVTPKKAPPPPAPEPGETSDPIGLLSSSSDSIMPASADIEDLLPGEES